MSSIVRLSGALAESSSPFWSLWGTSLGGIGFVMVGVRYTTMSPDFTLGNLVVGYIEAAAYYGA